MPGPKSKLLIALSYLVWTVETSSVGYRGNTSEVQVLQNKAARVILDLPAHSSATEALKMLGWKPLMRPP